MRAGGAGNAQFSSADNRAPDTCRRWLGRAPQTRRTAHRFLIRLGARPLRTPHVLPPAEMTAIPENRDELGDLHKGRGAEIFTYTRAQGPRSHAPPHRRPLRYRACHGATRNHRRTLQRVADAALESGAG